MHYPSHILLCCIVLWCTISGGKAARSSVSPDIIANFAKNVASVLSPVILEVQSRNNRSSFQSIPPVSANLNSDLNPRSILGNIVDKTSNGASYYEPRSYPYNKLYENSPEGLEGSEENEQLDESLRGGSYLPQEQPNKFYDFAANNDNFDETSNPSDDIDSSIQESSTNLYPSYHGAGFPKAAFPHGPFLDKPYGGFHGFGPYGHHHYHSYGGGSSEETSSDQNNGTNYRGYGSPYFDHPYSPFPDGGYGNRDSYGSYQRNGNDSSGNGRNGYGPYGYGPYYGGPDFYGPPGYGYNRGYNGYNNGNNNNSRQTDEAADNGDQNNSTKNGYLPPYGPPWVKPLGGIFHPHGFPFNLLPYDHFHGVLKGGPVAGVGHVGFPIYADPYLAGFPFHHLYGPHFYGKKYLPPKRKPAEESGEATEAPAGIMENENPERITMLNVEEVAPAPSSNRYKILGRKELKKTNLVNFGKSNS